MFLLWIRWGNQRQRDHWIPTQKMSRLLMTSCKAVKKMQRKFAKDLAVTENELADEVVTV